MIFGTTGMGIMFINYLYGAEGAPLAFRVPIYALTTTILWSFNFLVVEVTPVWFASLGYKFIIFAVINICLLTPGQYCLSTVCLFTEQGY
jgi:hypothetical protein